MHHQSESRGLGHALRWTLVAVLTGVAGGLAGLGLAALLHVIQHVAYGYSLDTLFSQESFQAGVMAATPSRRVAILTLCGLIAGCGWWAIYRWCKPLVSISRAVRGDSPSLPGVATTCHALLQIVTVALGSPLGREVAPREIGAMLAGKLSSYAALTVDESKVMVACGAGAGLAAVYNVPVAGAIYVVEGLLFSIGWRTVLPAIVTAVIAALVARIGLGTLPQYDVPHYACTPSLIVWSMLAGPLIGLAASQFTRLTDHARSRAPHDSRMLPYCLANFLFIGLLATLLPMLLGNGKGPAQVGFDGAVSVQLAAILLLLRILITWTSLRSGAAGGLLTPGLCNGALLAILLGGVWSVLWPGTPAGAFAVIGAAAFLATSMRVPFTAVALIFEFTRPSPEFIFPVLLAVAGSVATSGYLRQILDRARRPQDDSRTAAKQAGL
ncbi:H+/Cl- antiporter ClcA [Paraburkholderia sp. GAS199]|uniref:chloride channel protein n=1 Tax=Paraburkholderia sp. GAS199 TaxID=3035126 RepID=UPI003D2411BD